MKLIHLFALFVLVSSQATNVEFNAVYPFTEQINQISISIKVTDESDEQLFYMETLATSYNVTHQYTYIYPAGVSSELEYRYSLHFQNGTIASESFWRQLTSDRLQYTDSVLWRTVNEMYGQNETYLGVPRLPNISGIQVTPPNWFDDNQISVISLYISHDDLASVIFNARDSGETYVKTNVTLVNLNSINTFHSVKIRRAGAYTLNIQPYSYQLKLKENGPAAPTVIKLRSYPLPFVGGAIADKAASDICSSLGAPINYVSYARLYINGQYQGIYGMVEKVDENFVERRWPFLESGNSVGTLYKMFEHTYILQDSGFHSIFDQTAMNLASQNDTCCACFERGCDLAIGKCNECETLNCCSCTWQNNQFLKVETANCANQNPFQDFVELGNAILSRNKEDIDQILDAEGYLRSLLCDLVVMNVDGYTLNSHNYYWYRDPVTNQFKLILYDHDQAFTDIFYVHNEAHITPYDWTFASTKLADSPFLDVLLDVNPSLRSFYTNLLSTFLEEIYKSDQTGPLFERINLYSQLIQRYGGSARYTSEIKSKIAMLSDVLSRQLE